jgi:hypothetical protein
VDARIPKGAGVSFPNHLANPVALTTPKQRSRARESYAQHRRYLEDEFRSLYGRIVGRHLVPSQASIAAMSDSKLRLSIDNLKYYAAKDIAFELKPTATMDLCRVPGCDDAGIYGGLCESHFRKRARNVLLTVR